MLRGTQSVGTVGIMPNPSFTPEQYDMYQLIGAVSEATRELTAKLPMDGYRFVGGYPTAIMLDPETTFDRETKTMVAGRADLPKNRGNGTPKDLDFVVMTHEPDQARGIERELTEEFGAYGHTISVDHLRAPEVRRLGFVGHQAVDLAHRKAYMQLGPVQREVPMSTFEAWLAELGEDGTTQTWSPHTARKMYVARSLSGERAKDKKEGKREQLDARVAGIEELAADLHLYESWDDYIQAVADLSFANVLPFRPGSGSVLVNAIAKAVLVWGEDKKEIVEKFQQDSGVVNRVQRWALNR